MGGGLFGDIHFRKIQKRKIRVKKGKKLKAGTLCTKLHVFSVARLGRYRSLVVSVKKCPTRKTPSPLEYFFGSSHSFFHMIIDSFTADEIR